MNKKLIRKMLTAAGGPLFPWQNQNTELIDNWKFKLTPASRSRVLSGKGVETDKQYTERRKKETTKRTWRSDAADVAHGIGEGILALNPYTAIPYYGAKVGLDFLNGTYGWHTALNASVPLFHMAPQAVGLREATNVALEDAANAGSKTARNWRVAREINNATKKGVQSLEHLQPKVRTRYGDVEIDNPLLAYRLGTGIVKDFLKTGKVRAPELEGYGDEIVSTKFGSMNFGKDFKNPMFAQGKLFFGLPRKADRDLLVTSEPLALAVKSSSKVPSSVNGTVDAKYAGFNNGKIRSRRVLDYEGQLTPENTSAYTWDPNYGYRKVTTEPSTSLKFFERKPSTIQISPEELYKVLKDQELNGYYFMGHGTGRTNVNPLIIFDNGLRIKNGDIGNTTSPISLSNLSLWPHANSKEIIILPGKAESVKFDSARGRIPSDWYDGKTFQWDDNPGFEGSGLFAVLKPNATFIETEINGVPGVYTKPSAILGSYNTDTHVLRLNPNSQYKFQFGETSATPQTTAENAASEMPNIVRTVLDNGKIRLSLPSHTDSKPRQFVLEPAPTGDNKYYVHMRMWDDIENKVPASNVTNEEKQQLFDALYDELPEGAEILFPKSGPGNYGTRGTVVGLQRLSRDPRFTPGTKGTLQYLDKDGKTVRTYEGTSFIKTPKLQYLKQGGKMNILEFLKNGSGIHIKEKNKGKFTSYCGGKVTDECILKGKNSSNPAIRKRATFAANARHFKHKEGGLLKFEEGGKNGAPSTKFLSKLWFKNAGNNIGSFLNSDTGKGLLDIGLNILSGYADYKNTSNLLDSQVAQNKASLELSYLDIMLEAMKNRILKLYLLKKLWQLAYLNGETLDNYSDIVAQHVGWDLYSSAILNAEQLKRQQEALMDLQAKLAKSNALGNLFGSVVLSGLGVLGNVLGKGGTSSIPTTNTSTAATNNTLFSSPLNDSTKFWSIK